MFDYDAASDTFTPGTMADTAAAGERRQVRVRVPHDSEDKRLRFHGLREAVNGFVIKAILLRADEVIE